MFMVRVKSNQKKSRKTNSRSASKKNVSKVNTKGRAAAPKKPAQIKTKEVKGPSTRSGFTPNIAEPDEIKRVLGELLGTESAVNFLRKNVSKWAPDALNMLTTPKTDEYLAEHLGMKINAIRRILNLMQGYGVTNYYVTKNTNGWLSFAWYINASKVSPFLDYIKSVSSRKSVVTSECNDYFVCDSCYPKDKLIFTFDAAYEAAFRCNCGQKFAMIGKDAAEKLSVEEQRPASALELGGTL